MPDLTAQLPGIILATFLVLLVIFVILVIPKSLRIIPQAYAGVVDRLGRYQRTLTPGLKPGRERPLIPSQAVYHPGIGLWDDSERFGNDKDHEDHEKNEKSREDDPG